MSYSRPDGRQADQLRPVSFTRNFTRFAPGSVLARCGATQVLCTATVQAGVPKFLTDSGQGWLTAEYRMLPGATPQRQSRELLKLSGRTQEIQRLIGRSLRASLDLKDLGEHTITIDADVLQADAGTRTTAITGGFVALVDALNFLVRKGDLPALPKLDPIAAVSVGILQDEPLLDLCYQEDVAAAADCNVVMNHRLHLIEVQGTAEEGSFSRSQFERILDLAEKGIRELLDAQQAALKTEVAVNT